jgi:uncharacterized protein YecE (DUF72 family)
MARQLFIGTSGWHYKHWLGNFYPEGTKAPEMLCHYLKSFDTVELNNSFYHLPSEAAFKAWRAATPARFLFAVKASRFITHMKKLGNVEEGVERFLTHATNLGPKLGPILFQLPPRWKKNAERLREFLSKLPANHRYVFEFREPSWLDAEIYDILMEFNVAHCIYELEYFQSPLEITADFTYVRLHGPGLKYQGRYGDEGLQPWVERISLWKESLRQIFVYFDNDQEGYAAADALRLKELLG